MTTNHTISDILQRPLNVAVFSYNSKDDACGYLRIHAPLTADSTGLRDMWGLRHKRFAFIRMTLIDEKLLDSADLVVIQRTFPRERTRAFLNKIIASGLPVIYETDDLLTNVPGDNSYMKRLVQKRDDIIDFIGRVHAVTVSTECLRDNLLQYHDNITVLPNLIDENLWRTDGRLNRQGPIVIGFAGGKSHKNDLSLIEDALLAISAKYKQDVAFLFIGCISERLARLPNSRFIGFTSSYADYARLMRTASIDIGLAPLENNLFNNCKSNIKWLEYSACGIAGVFSDLPPYNRCIEHGETGLLVGPAPEDWINAIDSLISAPEKMLRIGSQARDKVLAEYTLAKNASLFTEAYTSLASKCNDSQGNRQ